MSRGSNQKFKFLYLMKIMQQKTDDSHGITMSQIMEELNKYGVTAERKSIYSDFSDMENFGLEVTKEQVGRETYYRVIARDFELAEVKLLVDAIQSSKFITQKKSRDLIKKLKGFVSEYQGSTLERQLFIDNRVKSMNESVFYNVDEIYAAINENKKIKFNYYKWDINKELVVKKDGGMYEVSPWALTWTDENYYMVAFDESENIMKNYRVDKMKNISLVDLGRTGRKAFDEYEISTLSKSTFGMYGGVKKRVTVELENSMCGVFLDRFGKEDITFYPVDKNHSKFMADVNVSKQFFAWLFGLGTQVRLVGPEDVVKELKEYTKAFLKNIG